MCEMDDYIVSEEIDSRGFDKEFVLIYVNDDEIEALGWDKALDLAIDRDAERAIEFIHSMEEELND